MHAAGDELHVSHPSKDDLQGVPTGAAEHHTGALWSPDMSLPCSSCACTRLTTAPAWCSRMLSLLLSNPDPNPNPNPTKPFGASFMYTGTRISPTLDTAVLSLMPAQSRPR